MADIAIERLTHIKSVKHNSEQIFGVKAVNTQIASVVKEGSADGDPGITSQDVTFLDITLTLEFESSAPLLQLIARDEANLEVTFAQSGGGNDRLRTYKNVRFRSPSANSSSPQDTNYERTSIQAKCTWGTDDTLATMITETDVT